MCMSDKGNLKTGHTILAWTGRQPVSVYYEKREILSGIIRIRISDIRPVFFDPCYHGAADKISIRGEYILYTMAEIF